MALIETWYEQDLKQPVKVNYLDGNYFSQDNQGNLVGVRVFDDGEPATLSGSVSASVIRADGATVAVSGTLSGNECYVILPQAAYAVPGVLSVVIKIASGSIVTTVCAMITNVYQSATDTTIDPGTIIPSIADLIETINNAVAAIPADYSVLSYANAIYNKKTGLYVAKLTNNNVYPYIDILIDGKSGDSLVMSLDFYSVDVSNITSWYLYNPSTSQTIATLSKDKRTKVNLASDISTVRVVFNNSTSISDIIAGFRCYIVGRKQGFDVIENDHVTIKKINATAGSDIIVGNIQMYAEKGDLVSIEIIDENGVLSDTYNCVAGYYNNGTQVSYVWEIHYPYKRGIAKINTSFDIDSVIFFVNSQYVIKTDSLKIRCMNLTKAGIPYIPRKYGSFSILGDSYSTYKGFTNPSENAQWYPANDPSTQGYGSGNNVSDVRETWWHLFSSRDKVRLEENASYSGSTICYDSYGTGTTDGKTTSFIQRRSAIGNPELLLIFGGTNDNWAGASIGEYKYSDWTESDLSYFAPALAYLIYAIRLEHIGIEIVFVENDLLTSAYKTAIETVCEHYSVPVIKLHDISKTYNHPNVAGMNEIYGQIVEYFHHGAFPAYE